MARGGKPCPPGCTCKKHTTPGRITPQCREASIAALRGSKLGPHSEERRHRISEGLRRAWASPDSGFHEAFTPEVIEKRNVSIRAAYAGSRARARRDNRARGLEVRWTSDAPKWEGA